MKKILLLLFVWIAALLPAKAQSMIDPEDEAGIQQTIAGETAAYVNRDSALVLSYYTNDPITQAVWNAPDGGYGSYRGYDVLKANLGSDFHQHPEKPIEPTVERTDWFFRPLGRDWMWVNFTQRSVTPDGKKMENYETRVMKKERGKWKIAVMYAMSDHGGH